MSTATMRRNRDERNGEGANIRNKRLDTTLGDTVLAEQYISYMPGVQDAESGQQDAPATVDELGRSIEHYELVNGAGDESGSNPAAADREADNEDE